MSTQAVEQLIITMAEELAELIKTDKLTNPVLIGIHTGGAWIAERLHSLLALSEPLGTLDISFYRDDFTRIGINPQVKPSQLPFSLDDRNIILVDDVLFTGRTIRAALNEIFDYGRPSCVVLAVLIDRGGRELPLQATVVGQQLSLQANEQVKLSGPAPLKYEIQKASNNTS
ncbi:Pyrimidine operon regulatory protein PyrR [hydrothermal vent metagenome]|uniref:Pyrimidine operon regulatory protein PyrR n=1 Tax=hydrothermal vent metagenome TaxID=652676 RepID=A0A3B0YW98_9ZZZZ